MYFNENTGEGRICTNEPRKNICYDFENISTADPILVIDDLARKGFSLFKSFGDKQFYVKRIKSRETILILEFGVYILDKYDNEQLKIVKLYQERMFPISTINIKGFIDEKGEFSGGLINIRTNDMGNGNLLNNSDKVSESLAMGIGLYLLKLDAKNFLDYINYI